MEFDDLKDLVKTITRNKTKQIEILGSPTEDGSMIEAFYDAISKDKISSDEDAAKYLYGKNEGPKSQAYLRLKGRLERNLLNTAFFVDVNQPMFNERTKAYYNCYRDFAASYILLGREARKPGVHLLEQVIEQCIKYEFVELAAEISRRLRIESRGLGNSLLHEKYTKINREYEEMRRLELMASDYFENLINYYFVKRSPNEEVHKLASAYYDELLPLAAVANTSQFYNFTGQIGIIKYLSVNDCKGALEISAQTLEILTARPNTNRAAIVMVAFQKIACLTQLRNFDGEVNNLVNLCLSLTEEGQFNWFRLQEIHLHYCLFAQQYQDALALYEKASTHPKFESLGGAVRDNWQLFGGYLHLLAAFGKLPAEKVQQSVGAFRYTKISNEIVVVGKDKEGMNIPLVLLPVLYSLAQGKYEIAPENLEKYRKRHLEGDMNKRSAAFLNLLIAFARRDTKVHLVQKAIQKQLDLLAKEQPLVAGQTFAVEIIPYEDLWEMLNQV